MPFANKKTSGKPFVSSTGERIFELAGSENLSGALVEVDPGGNSPKHVHHELTEIYFILAGEMRLVVDDEEYHLKPDDMFLIEPGQVHQLFNDGDELLEFFVPTGPEWYPEDFHEV